MGRYPALLARAALLGVVILVYPAHAGDDSSVKPTTAPGLPSGKPGTQGSLDLSIRAQALGILAPPRDADRLGIEAERAPTGAGTTRMPQAVTELRPGLYLSVMPACVPGYDDFPVPRRRGAPPRR